MAGGLDLTHERALRDAAASFDRAFELATVGMALIAVDDLRFLRVNGTWVDLLGWTEAELLTMSNGDLTHPDELAASLRRREMLVDGMARSVQAEKRVRCADGSYRWMLVSVTLVRDDEGEPLFVLSQLQDIHAQKQLEAELALRAEHDALTGLANRSAFLRELGSAMAAQARLAVLFLDLDDFKAINDRGGHAAGDAILVEVGRCLRAATRPEDVLARFGGDEFVVLVPWPGGSADDLVDRFAASLRPSGMRASIGIACVEPGDRRRPESVIDAADAAMYAVKQRRRTGVHA